MPVKAHATICNLFYIKCVIWQQTLVSAMAYLLRVSTKHRVYCLDPLE